MLGEQTHRLHGARVWPMLHGLCSLAYLSSLCGQEKISTCRNHIREGYDTALICQFLQARISDVIDIGYRDVGLRRRELARQLGLQSFSQQAPNPPPSIINRAKLRSYFTHVSLNQLVWARDCVVESSSGFNVWDNCSLKNCTSAL